MERERWRKNERMITKRIKEFNWKRDKGRERIKTKRREIEERPQKKIESRRM